MTHSHFFRPAVGLVLVLMCVMMLWLRQRPVGLPVVGILIGALLIAADISTIDRRHQQHEMAKSSGSRIATPGLARAAVSN